MRPAGNCFQSQLFPHGLANIGFTLLVFVLAAVPDSIVAPAVHRPCTT